MSSKSLLAALAAVAVIAAAAVPAEAARKKYKFSFAGTTTRAVVTRPALGATWEWPVNPFNKNRRDSDSFAVLKGAGCGTRPDRAVWTIRTQSGTLPAQPLKIDFVHNPDQKNPAPVVDAMYAGDPPPGQPRAHIKFTVRFPALPSQVTLVAKPTGDVANLDVNPATAKISRTRVRHC